MIEVLKNNTKIDFVKHFRWAFVISFTIVLIGFFGLIKGIEYGVDFKGGVEVQVHFNKDIQVDELRKAMDDHKIPASQVQSVGDKINQDFIIKLQGKEEELTKLDDNFKKQMAEFLQAREGNVVKVDMVGPKAGDRLRTAAFLAMFWASVAICIYLGLRFDFKFAPGAVVALMHDVGIILFVYMVFKVEFTLQTVGALLAVIGYSVNDTVVVYDRIREVELANPELSFHETVNRAVNETLSRTIITAGATFLVSASLYFFGGPAIQDFFLAMSVGILTGTYSSIFIAAPLTLYLEKFKGKKVNKVVPQLDA